MLDHFTNYEYYSVGSATPEPQRLRFSPKPHNKIGVYFGWRWIFLGWAIDADGLYGKKSGKKRGTDFSQSTNQRRNAGSFIAGFSVSTHNLDFDYTKLPDIIRETMNPGMKVDHIKYTNISLNFGYAYNWVFARNCLACLSLNPAVAYKTSRINKAEGEKDDWYRNFNIDFILRAGVVYNNSKYFVGTSFVGRTYDYYRNNFSLNNGFGTLQVYAGFNFCLKKEHRKKKRQ